MTKLHPAVQGLLVHFTYDHLPDTLAEVSKPFCELAQHMADTLPDGAEKTAGMRKLLEAKDCAVRAQAAGQWIDADKEAAAEAPADV